MGCIIQMFPGCHGVEFVLAMSAFSGSIPFSHNVTMLVYRHSLSLNPSICTLKHNRPNKLEVASIALEGCQRREICHYTNHATPIFHYQRVLVVVRFLFQRLLFIPLVTSERAVIEFNGMQLRQIQVVMLSNTME